MEEHKMMLTKRQINRMFIKVILSYLVVGCIVLSITYFLCSFFKIKEGPEFFSGTNFLYLFLYFFVVVFAEGYGMNYILVQNLKEYDRETLLFKCRREQRSFIYLALIATAIALLMIPVIPVITWVFYPLFLTSIIVHYLIYTFFMKEIENM